MGSNIARYAIHSPNCKLENKVPGVIDLTNTIPEVYTDYKYNEHHWTTNYVWTQFIPRLSTDIGIPFSFDDFSYVKSIRDGHDLSYHIPLTDEIVAITDLYFNTTDLMHISDTVFNRNYKEYLGCFTDYHWLFICAHRNALISNSQSITNRNLLLNTDSMSIPLMTFLMHYFNNILILDNRTDRSYEYQINEFLKHSNLTYVELLIADSWNMHKYERNIR